jgi:hypothetical protein
MYFEDIITQTKFYAKMFQAFPTLILIITESIYLLNAQNPYNTNKDDWILQDNDWIEISFFTMISFLFIWNIFIAFRFRL